MTRLLIHLSLFLLLSAALAGGAIELHRSMASGDSESGRRLRDFYLRTSQPSGKPVNAVLIDQLAPCVVFGLAAGLLLWRWPRLLFAAWVFVSVLTMTFRLMYERSIHFPTTPALFDARASLLQKMMLWFGLTLFHSIFCGIFAYFGWALHHPNNDPAAVRLSLRRRRDL